MNLELIPNVDGSLLNRYHDRFLACDSLTDVEVLLLSLYLTEQKNMRSGATYNEVKERFLSLGRKRNNFYVAIYKARRSHLVEVNDNVVSFLSKGLRHIKEIVGQPKRQSVHLTKSGEFFTAIKRFEEFLQNEMKRSEILLVDPYISSNTLHPFSVLKGSLKLLRILTSNIYEEKKFEELKKKFEREMGTKIEIKKNSKIHDRWLICGKECWSIGSSIKDLGNKDTAINKLEGVANSLEDLFHSRWDDSTSST